MDPEGQRLGRLDVASVGGEGLQRVEVGAPRVRVPGRDHAAPDVPLRDDDRLAHRDAAAEPGVFGVRRDVLDPEVHAEPATVDLLDAERFRERPERCCGEQGRRSTAAAVGGAVRGLDEAHLLPDEVRDGLGPRAADEPGGMRPRMEQRLDLLPALDRGAHHLAAREAQGKRVGVLVVVGMHELQRAALLVVEQASRLGDEVEAAVAFRPALEQLDLVDEVQGRPLDRRQRDPGDAAAHRSKASWLEYGPGPPRTAEPARAASASASPSASPRARPKASAAANESPAP